MLPACSFIIKICVYLWHPNSHFFPDWLKKLMTAYSLMLTLRQLVSVPMHIELGTIGGDTRMCACVDQKSITVCLCVCVFVKEIECVPACVFQRSTETSYTGLPQDTCRRKSGGKPVRPKHPPSLCCLRD